MPSDDAPLVGGLFAVAAALEAEEQPVRFENVYEERPATMPEVKPSPARLAMVRVLAASPACTHQGSTTRH
jgi:hypothetical protein